MAVPRNPGHEYDLVGLEGAWLHERERTLSQAFGEFGARGRGIDELHECHDTARAVPRIVHECDMTACNTRVILQYRRKGARYSTDQFDVAVRKPPAEITGAIAASARHRRRWALTADARTVDQDLANGPDRYRAQVLIDNLHAVPFERRADGSGEDRFAGAVEAVSGRHECRLGGCITETDACLRGNLPPSP